MKLKITLSINVRLYMKWPIKRKFIDLKIPLKVEMDVLRKEDLREKIDTLRSAFTIWRSWAEENVESDKNTATATATAKIQLRAAIVVTALKKNTC